MNIEDIYLLNAVGLIGLAALNIAYIVKRMRMHDREPRTPKRRKRVIEEYEEEELEEEEDYEIRRRKKKRKPRAKTQPISISKMARELEKALKARKIAIMCPEHKREVEVLLDGTIICPEGHRIWPPDQEELGEVGEDEA